MLTRRALNRFLALCGVVVIVGAIMAGAAGGAPSLKALVKEVRKLKALVISEQARLDRSDQLAIDTYTQIIPADTTGAFVTSGVSRCKFPGEKPVGGGGRYQDSVASDTMLYSVPHGDGWAVAIRRQGGQSSSALLVYVTCAKLQ